MCTDKEFEEIAASGCNMSSDIEHKAAVNKLEVEEIIKDSSKKLRAFLF